MPWHGLLGENRERVRLFVKLQDLERKRVPVYGDLFIPWWAIDLFIEFSFIRGFGRDCERGLYRSKRKH